MISQQNIFRGSDDIFVFVRLEVPLGPRIWSRFIPAEGGVGLKKRKVTPNSCLYGRNQL